MTTLHWPVELAGDPDAAAERFVQRGSNICLDLHGDPQRAQLHVFSDGNHHMALEEALKTFLAQHPQAVDVFYATTPPRVIVQALCAGTIRIGNLLLPAKPHVFISPPQVLDSLVADGHMRAHRSFAANLGVALLVSKGNPKNIRGIADLARSDVRIFLSNPVTEAVSHEAYAATLRKVAARDGVQLEMLDSGNKNSRVIYGEAIHHREAPQCVACGRADVAVVYHHLALRYVRIFPTLFEMIALGRGAGNDPDHATGALHIGMVADGGKWGRRLVEFMTSPAVGAIYEKHGLAAA